MIGKLKGQLSEVNGNVGLIETSGGVFYQCFLTPELLAHHRPPCPIVVYTYLQVRDDALVLFGFSSREEHDFFQLLLTVPGVGPKTAYGIISGAKIDEIITATKNNDTAYFTRIPGLGKKTALKIILELSQKLKTEFKLQETELSEDDKTVLEALKTLGINHQDAIKKLQSLDKVLTIEDKIKTILKTKS